jgi:hypothetical protein
VEENEIGFEEAVMPEADPILDDGQVAPEGDIAPEPNYLDVDQYGDYYAKVKVDGEELDVPVAEALQGYQRQADYTRKTQELSQRAEQVQFWETVDRAMQADPQATLQFLQNQYGIGQAQVAANTSYDEPSYEEDWFSDPSEKRIAQLENQLQGMQMHFETQQATQVLEQVVGHLQQKYGEDFDPKAVVSEAVRRGIPDPRYLEPLYKEMAFDRLNAQSRAQADAGARRAAEDQARRAAAQDAASTVGRGTTSGAQVQTNAPVTRPKTIQEAWALAKQQTAS